MVGDLGGGVMMVRSSSMASLIAVAVTGSSGRLLAVLMVDTNSSGALVALSATAAAGNWKFRWIFLIPDIILLICFQRYVTQDLAAV